MAVIKETPFEFMGLEKVITKTISPGKSFTADDVTIPLQYTSREITGPPTVKVTSPQEIVLTIFDSLSGGVVERSYAGDQINKLGLQKIGKTLFRRRPKITRIRHIRSHL